MNKHAYKKTSAYSKAKKDKIRYFTGYGNQQAPLNKRKAIK
jgi:hypothetical protein